MTDTTLRSNEIQLKGMHYGLRIVLPEEPEEALLLKNFEAVPAQRYALPMGTGVVLDFQGRSCSEKLISEVLYKVVWPRGITVLSWLSSNPKTLGRLIRAGLQTAEPQAESGGGSGNVILDHSLRSGQREEFPGDIVLVGHLNSGAEIFAGGSIAVLGKLKGLVHAGRKGAERAYVIAGSFEPQQVRIGDKLCSGLGEDMKWWKKTVIITLEEGRLLVRELKLHMAHETV